MTGELVQEGIGRGMVRLARIAHNADAAREEDEEVQIAVHCRAVQVPSPHDLRPQHLLKARPGLVGERGVRQHAHAVDDATKRRQRRINACQHRVNCRGVSHVSQLDFDPNSASAKGSNSFFSLGVGVSTAVQDDGAGALVREPFGDGTADAAQTTSDQVGAVLPHLTAHERRRRQDDLANVPGRTHEPQCGSRLGQGPPAVDERFQLSRRKPRHDVSQHHSNRRRVGLLHHVEFKDGVAHVRTCRGHLVLAQDVPSRQLDEATTMSQARQAGVNKAFARQAVQHDVDALAASGLEDFLAKLGLAAIEYVLDAE